MATMDANMEMALGLVAPGPEQEPTRPGPRLELTKMMRWNLKNLNLNLDKVLGEC